MTKPLTEEVAKKYGYGNIEFKWWLEDYFYSLELLDSSRKVKPIEYYSVSNITTALKPYITDAKEFKNTGYIRLNPNYIYMVTPSGYGDSTHYVPIETPFDSKTQSSVRNMKGVYRDRQSNHTYTGEGFNPSRYRIIGVLRFPTEMQFMNWQINPLGGVK